MYNDFTETEIIEASRRGDLDAFNALIVRHQDFIFRVALRVMQSEDLADDAVQEACLLAFRKIDSFRGGAFRNWLARIVINVCYDELRRQKRRRTQTLEPTLPGDEEAASSYWLADYSTAPENLFDAGELETLIQNCLESIAPHHRAVLILIDMEELSYEAAADILEIPAGTIKSRLARARVQMRGALQMLGDMLPARYQIQIPVYSRG